MFSLDTGRPIAKIIGGNLDNQIIYLKNNTNYDDDSKEPQTCCSKCSLKCKKKKCCNNCEMCYCQDENDNLLNEIKLKKGILLPLPNIETRDIPYICGPEGSGKSYYAGKYCDAFLNMFPDKQFFVFSRKDNDPAIDNLNPIRIKIDESLINDPIDLTKELTNGALILFDDVNTIQNDKLKKEVDKLIGDILEVGRAFEVYIVITNHLIIPNEKKIARTILNSCHSITVFPKSGTSQQIEYALQKYCGLKKNQVQKILDLPSRWVTVYKKYPQFVIYNKGCYIL